MAKYIVHNGIRIASDFVPETFGRLTTIGPKFRVGKHCYQVCQCRCNSDESTVHRTDVLLSGKVKSCGCLQKELLTKRSTTHGHSYRSERWTWVAMIRRCHNPKDKSFPRYGKRGIQVCREWSDPVTGYDRFLEHMGPKPTPNHSIDRYPIKNGNYEPGNCRWATTKEQNRNRKDNRMLTAFGKTQCMAEWAEEYGLAIPTLFGRLKKGWEVEKAISTPARSIRPVHKKN